MESETRWVIDGIRVRQGTLEQDDPCQNPKLTLNGRQWFASETFETRLDALNTLQKMLFDAITRNTEEIKREENNG